MDDAVVGRHHAVVGDAKLLGVTRQRLYLLTADGVGDGLVLVVRRRVVVGHTIDVVGTEAAQSTLSHPFESLRRRHLVTVEAVDV